MQSVIPNPELRQNRVLDWLKSNTRLVVVFLILLAFPFIVALLDGQSFSALLANETGNANILQGLMIEVFILAVYAISYDLILGITGLLSFGHAMFFAVGAYVGAAVFRLLQFYLDKWFGEISSFLIGLIYVLLVLFIPYGIVGTWRVHSFRAKQGRQYLARLLSGGLYQSEAEIEEEEPEDKLSSDTEEEPD